MSMIKSLFQNQRTVETVESEVPLVPNGSGYPVAEAMAFWFVRPLSEKNPEWDWDSVPGKNLT